MTQMFHVLPSVLDLGAYHNFILYMLRGFNKLCQPKIQWESLLPI